jgi:hypothetical protein
MSKIVQLGLMGIVGVVVVGGVLYLTGFRIIGPSGQPIFPSSGSAKHHAGWRRAAEAQGQPGQMDAPGSGQGRMAQGMMPEPGSGGGSQSSNQAGPGSGHGRQGRGSGGGGGRSGGGGRQAGYGPSGGILLPNKPGSTTIPVVAGGKTASIVGQDLVDHVEDTVVATADGPRKGWAVAKTLKYLGVENFKEVTLIGSNGKKVTVSSQQINDQQTIPLFTYNESGLLMVVSGPKVRGANNGTLTMDDVKKAVAGRTDLLNVTSIEQVEVKG